MGKPTLRQQAYARILDMIETGECPKGSVTSEVQLGRQLDMSRTPIRAALQQLELEGYVRIASKHGVLILDSSSQRVGDLLELIGSMALFAVGAAFPAGPEVLRAWSRGMSEAYRTLNDGDPEDIGALVAFEYELLNGLILRCNNSEMTKAFQTYASRLFWHRNVARWQAPYSGRTRVQVAKLIAAVAAGPEPFREALFDYLHTLKLTWR
ncbi:DNA-binding transcriptional regulator, GntR family [Cohnella sp. OV330]|uniref:GntR family transcriptional regulator n=1 Tax=Cohnella sp. OV330 TaxID=1855288 RepID=UPI0008E991F7|nr:GntR family transcriptional regulator [Cohnella sp. OV330]SFA81846.1 DNA-binding transcriptional regulator, GntR family [Cohnella sp. OV330]